MIQGALSTHKCQWCVVRVSRVPLIQKLLTVDDRISCGQQASKKLLQTFESEYFT